MGNRGSRGDGGAGGAFRAAGGGGGDDDGGGLPPPALSAEQVEALRGQIARLIAYAEGADTALQKAAAEKLANEAVSAGRQELIVDVGGLDLLRVLLRSTDADVLRLAAHTLANLSALPRNQLRIAEAHLVPPLVALLSSRHASDAVLRQAAKALANVAVAPENKARVLACGSVDPLVALAAPGAAVPVRVEAVAALANLAVDDAAEAAIGARGGIEAVLDALASADGELAAQAARAIRNLSCDPANKARVLAMPAALPLLRRLAGLGGSGDGSGGGGGGVGGFCGASDASVRQQTQRALTNLGIAAVPPPA
jgi:hypothetical protein